MGNSNNLVRPPPALTITNSRVSGNLRNTTQNALLASPADLQASVTPGNLNGTYSWTFTGPYGFDPEPSNPSSKSVFWTEPGTFLATVTYAGTGFSVSGTITIQVRVPTLTSFSGTSSGNTLDRGSNCSQVSDGVYLPYGATFGLGCYLNSPTGMRWSATATIPNVSYLSDLHDAGIQFKQITSLYRRRLNKGRQECFTARNSQFDPATGWQLDSANPFRSGYYQIPTFLMGKTITAQEFDSPTTTLDGRLNSTGAFFEYDAKSVDDRFETYVQYFTGSALNPSFMRLLHVADSQCPADRFDCGIDRLVWTWGGNVNFDSAMSPLNYAQTATSSTIGTVPLIRAATERQYSGLAQQNNQAALCAGAPEVTNPIDGARFFVQQQYLDILNRPPDAPGWDGWKSVINRCAFDMSCINSQRIHVARGFLESPENFANNPALANPGSHVYNREYVRLCYTSFLDRVPDGPGWDGWTDFIDTHPGQYDNLVGGFINSIEYRQRFGTP